MKRGIIVILVMSFSFWSCHQKGKKTAAFENVNPSLIENSVADMPVSSAQSVRIAVDLSDEMKVLDVSMFADSVHYIPLETSEQSLIGKVDKLVIRDSLIYVLDRSKNRGIYVFSFEGKFLQKIGNVGQGPGEYAEPTDISIYGNTVYVYDQYTHRISLFDRDGNYLSAKKVPFFSMGFHVFNDSTFVFNTPDADNYHLPALVGYSVLLSDSTWKVRKRGFYRELDKYTAVWIPENFQGQDTLVYYHAPFSGNIFTIDAEGNATQRFTLDFGDKALPEKYLEEANRKRFSDESVQSSYLLFPGNFHETSSWFYFAYLKAHVQHYGFYDKHKKRLWLAGGIINDIFPAISFGQVVGAMGNQLYSVVFPDNLLFASAQLDRDELQEQIGVKGIEFLSTLKEGDNPILLISYLK